MLSRKYKRHGKRKKEPLTKELKVQIALGIIPLIIKTLEILLDILND